MAKTLYAEWSADKGNIYDIFTVVGTNESGYSGDGGAATDAELSSPSGVAMDGLGNLYVADTENHRVRKVDTSGIISTFAGTGEPGYSGDGGAATSAQLHAPWAVAIDDSGNVYVADTGNCVIRKVDANGTISTFAGNGTSDDWKTEGPATSVALCDPKGVAVDNHGNVYIADTYHCRIHKVDSSGFLTTIAGIGGAGYSGDGGPATSAELNNPLGVTVDHDGNVYIADTSNYLVRKVDTKGIIHTVAGTQQVFYNGDGCLATSANLYEPQGVAIDSGGDLYITEAFRVRKVDSEGIIHTIAGTGMRGYSGDGGAATSAQVWCPCGIIVESSGNVYIADSFNSRVRKLVPSYTVTYDGNRATSGSVPVDNNTYLSGATVTVVGNTGDLFKFGYKFAGWNTSADGSGTKYIAGATFTIETANVILYAEWKANQYVISTIAGTGEAGYSGDGGAATSAELSFPNGLGVDSTGNVYVADMGNYRVRKVDTSEIISTFAGTGEYGYSGDGGPATSAELFGPEGVSIDHVGNVYFADGSRIRKVDSSGIISTFAGTGEPGYSGDGGPATSAELCLPAGIAIDHVGNVYIADTNNHRIRKVDSSGIISTFAGTGAANDSGDGGPATSAGLHSPIGVAVDSSGNVYISDAANNRIRKVDTSGIIRTFAGTADGGYSGDGGAATSAQLNTPWGLAVDNHGNVYIADSENYRIRKVDTSGIISTIAGTGEPGYSVHVGVATHTNILPRDIVVDSNLNVYFTGVNCVQKLTPSN